MAFWVSSPVTDPSMMIITGGIIGPDFAIAKTVAAFSIGMFAGVATAGLPGFRGSVNELMRTEALEQYGCCEADRSRFRPEVMSNTRLALRWLALALVLEVFLQRLVPDEWIMSLFGNEAEHRSHSPSWLGRPCTSTATLLYPSFEACLKWG